MAKTDERMVPGTTADTNFDEDDGLLGTALPIMLFAYIAALAIVTFTFFAAGEALLSIGVCFAYVAMFFGVPWLMARIRNAHDTRWKPDAPSRHSHEIEVYSGKIGRFEAILQMVIVPLCVMFMFAAFAVIWLMEAP
ncbi:MAG: hypothetical protein ACK5JT_07305 [Hyphomicrobiaceae bacterium]